MQPFSVLFLSNISILIWVKTAHHKDEPYAGGGFDKINLIMAFMLRCTIIETDEKKLSEKSYNLCLIIMNLCENDYLSSLCVTSLIGLKLCTFFIDNGIISDQSHFLCISLQLQCLVHKCKTTQAQASIKAILPPVLKLQNEFI